MSTFDDEEMQSVAPPAPEIAVNIYNDVMMMSLKLYTSVSYHYCALLASWSSQCIEMHSWPIQAAHDVTHRAQYMCVFMLNSLACLHSATLKGYTALMATLMLFPS